MDTARSRPSSPRVAVPRAPSSRARETRAHKTRPRVPLAPHPRATSRAHRATDNPRSGDRGTSSNGSRERLPRRRRPRVATRERARTTHLAGAHGDRALRARRAVESHVARRLDGGGADGEHDDPLASRRSVRASPRRGGAWGGVSTRIRGSCAQMSGKFMSFSGCVSLGFSWCATSVDSSVRVGWGPGVAIHRTDVGSHTTKQT